MIMRKSKEVISSQQLLDDLSAVVADAEELLRATASQTGERIAAVRSRAEESVKVAKSRIADVQDNLMDQAKVAAKEADAYMHENPWKAAGIAAAVGVLIGAIISRR
jgi:ElaB/YqjD/DUF883 family membrane-anchored ribosome-binding protein